MPSTISARPPVRATTIGAPAAIASSATMPNGSYSDGITTHPARWSRSRSSSSGTKPGELHDVADALDVDLHLQFRQVRATAGDDAADARARGGAAAPIGAASTWKPFSYCTRPHASTSGSRGLIGAGRRWRPHRRCRRRSGTRWTFSDGSSKPSITSSHHEPRAGDHLAGLVREPPLDGVDRRRLPLRHVPAVAAPLGGVDGGDERHVPQRLQRVAGPGDEPVVGVDDVGPPVAEPRGQLGELVVGRGHAGDDVVVGEPGQVGAGPEHAHAVDDRVVAARRGGAAEHDDLVAGPGHAPARGRRRARRCRRPRAAGTPTTASATRTRPNVAGRVPRVRSRNMSGMLLR